MKQLIVCSILAHTAVTGSRVAVSLSGIELKASTFSIGMMLSLYSLLPMFILVGAGRWVDRIGLRKPILMGAGLGLFGVCVPFLVFDVGALFLAAICIGLGFMIFLLCLQKITGDTKTDEQRKANFSLVALSFSVSGFLGPTSAGLLIDSIGHRATFGVLAACFAIALIGVYRYRFEPHQLLGSNQTMGSNQTIGSNQTNPQLTSQKELAPKQAIADLLREPTLKRLYVCVVVICAAWDIHQFLVPIYGAQIGLSASRIGIILGVFALATFLIRTCLPFISKRIGEWPLILGAMAIAAVVYCVYPFAKTQQAMMVLAGILGLGLGMAQPMVMSVMYRVAPADRIGEATGLRLSFVNASQTFLPMTAGALGGILGGNLGFAPMFWGVAAFLAAGVVYVGPRVLGKNREIDPEDAQTGDRPTQVHHKKDAVRPADDGSNDHL